MSLDVELLRSAALETREAFEMHPERIDLDLLAELYATYNPAIPDSLKFVESAIDSFPFGACGVASVWNRHLLGGIGQVMYGRYEYRSKSVGHTVLHISELDLISCVTSDQFDGKPIHVGEPKHPWSI